MSGAGNLARDIRATLMPGFIGLTTPAWVREAFDDGLVSVCVYNNNVRDREQLTKLGAELRAAAPKGLIAIDEEGGEVTRLHHFVGSPYPGAAILGRINDLAYTEEIGHRVGSDLHASGFDLALAPDADVNCNPRNPVIGTRSFGERPETVAAHVAAWVRGLRQSGVFASPKHFPGHGDTTEDSHLALPVIDASLDTLLAREFPPFAAAIAAGAETIMTSHLLLPQIDPTAPATLSRKILQELLRKRLGFTGVIITDALDMEGASADIGIEEAAVRALDAGCDLLCLGTKTVPEQLRSIEEHVLKAVNEGRLAAERIHEAAERVRALAGSKAGQSVAAPPLPDSTPHGHGGSTWTLPAPAEVARIAASFDGAENVRPWLAAHPDAAVIRVDSQSNRAVGVTPWGPFAAAAQPLPHQLAAARAFTGRWHTQVDPGTPAPWQGQGTLQESRFERGVIIIGRDLHRQDFARDGIDSLRAAGIPTLVIEMGWPEPPVDGVRRYADVACFGASALAGAALLTLLEPAEKP